MSRRLKLELFEPPDQPPEAEEARVGGTALEELRLAAYESGYTAGWDDAVSAHTNDQTRVQAEVARNLQALSFTYHEARSHVLRTLEPLLRDMVAKVLPGMARESLAPIVLDALRPVAARMANVSVTVTLNPASRPMVEALLAAEATLPFVIAEEPSLGEGQVFLRFGDREQQVDLDGVIAAIAAAVDSFFHIEHQEKAYG